MSECKRCRQRGKTWTGSNPQCAFATGYFSGNNWNCATAHALRELVEPDAMWSEDQYVGRASRDGRFLVLSWYKRRGRTEGAWFVYEGRIRNLSLKRAEWFLSQEAA